MELQIKTQQMIKRLQFRLNKAADASTKQWFDNYLKGSITYRGIKSPKVVVLLKDWLRDEKLEQQDLALQLKIACDLLRQSHAEDKFAGIFYLQKLLIKKLPLDDLASAFEELFAENCFHDWSTTDWFTVRVLAPLIEIHEKPAIDRFTSWSNKANLWQRRCSIVCLRACVKKKDCLPIIEAQIAKLVSSKERFIQTGIGWVIADLAKHHPKDASRIVDRHLSQLSLEVIKRHTKRLSKHQSYLVKKKTDNKQP